MRLRGEGKSHVKSLSPGDETRYGMYRLILTFSTRDDNSLPRMHIPTLSPRGDRPQDLLITAAEVETTPSPTRGRRGLLLFERIVSGPLPKGAEESALWRPSGGWWLGK